MTKKFTFTTTVAVSIPNTIKDRLQKFINKCHVGQESVNCIDSDGNIQPIPDLVISDDHKEAEWRINAVHRINLQVSVDENGNFSFLVV